MWLKIAEKSDTKYIGNFLYVLRCFLSNLCNNLSYILYRKFPICLAQRFLANLSNNLLYYIKYFQHVLRSVFWLI